MFGPERRKRFEIWGFKWKDHRIVGIGLKQGWTNGYRGKRLVIIMSWRTYVGAMAAYNGVVRLWFIHLFSSK